MILPFFQIRFGQDFRQSSDNKRRQVMDNIVCH